MWLFVAFPRTAIEFDFLIIAGGIRSMSNVTVLPYTEVVKDLMGRKSYLLAKAQALSEIGMTETTQPLFLSAAAYEERIAALLDTEGRELEAAVHRISAASCYAKANHLGHAVNLYRAALAGPLRENTRADVLQLLNDCLTQFAQQAALPTSLSSMPEAIPVVS
jgi:hypothetical protein